MKAVVKVTYVLTKEHATKEAAEAFAATAQKGFLEEAKIAGFMVPDEALGSGKLNLHKKATDGETEESSFYSSVEE